MLAIFRLHTSGLTGARRRHRICGQNLLNLLLQLIDDSNVRVRKANMHSPGLRIDYLAVACVGLMGLTEVIASGEEDALSEKYSGQPRVVTFNRHIAPIVFDHCAVCHRPGESAPFSLLNYRQVKRRESQIAEVTRTRYMPPWKPEFGYARFVGERRLSKRQIALIQRWIRQGSVEGDPQDLPPSPKFIPGWQLGEPDHVVRMAETYILDSEGTDIYRNFVIPSNVTETRYVRAVEFRPSNSQIVHHCNLRVDSTFESRRLDREDSGTGFEGMLGEDADTTGRLVGWHPGRFPVLGPANLAWTLPRGADLVLLLHMLPTGKPESLDFTIGFHFSDTPPTRRSFVIRLASKTIDIPPETTDYSVEDHFELPVDVEVFGVRPHAHLLGKDIRGYATLPSGKRRWLIRIKDWDFNWQDEYRYEKPLVFPRGTRLSMRYSYDNSSANPRNSHRPPRRVRWGSNTTDEMGVLFVEVSPKRVSEYGTLVAAFEKHELQLDVASARKWLKGSPRDSEQHVTLGISLMGLGNTREAIDHFRQAIDFQPKMAVAYYNLAMALASLGRHDDAIEEFQWALRYDPNSARARYGLGLTLAAQGDSMGAIEQYQKTLQLQPNYAEAHNNLGAVLATQDRLNEAVEHWRQAVAINPNYAEAHNNLGLAVQREGKNDAAARHFRAALQSQPAFAAAARNLGRTLAAQGKLKQAIVSLQESLRLAPQAADTHYDLSKALVVTGRHADALKHLRRAMKLKSSWVPPINEAAWILATHPDEKLRDMEEAIRLAEQAARLTKGRHPIILSTLAGAYASAGQYSRAVATAEKAVSIAEAAGAGKLADQIRHYLRYYRQKKPFREVQKPRTSRREGSPTERSVEGS